MALFPTHSGHDGDGHIAKRPDHPFGGRLRGRLRAAGRVQAHQCRALFLQRRPQPLLGQHQHAQGQTQQPDQPGDTGLVAQKDRAQVQIARFEAAEGALMHRLLVIGGDQGRYVVLRGGRVRHIHLPAQPVDHRLPGGQVHPHGRDDPGRGAIAQADRLQCRLHHPVQFGLRNSGRDHLGQIDLLEIPFAAPDWRLGQLEQVGGQAVESLFAQPAHAGLIGGRTDNQDAFRPGVGLLRHRVNPRLWTVEGVDDRVLLYFAGAAVDRLDAQPGRGVGQGSVHPSGDLGPGVDGTIGAQIAAATDDDLATRGQVAHLAVADHQHIRAAQRRDGRVIGRHVHPVIAFVSGDRLAADRQPERVKRGQHQLELAQVGAMVLTPAMLEQAVGFPIVVVDAHAGAVQPHSFGRQVIDPHSALEQGGIEGGLRGRVAEQRQDDGQTVVGAVGVAQRNIQQRIDRLDAICGPVAYRHHAMVALLEDVAQPDAQHRAHARPFPVAMRRHMRVDQVPNAHIHDQAEQQRQAIDLLVGDGECRWCHAARIPQR